MFSALPVLWSPFGPLQVHDTHFSLEILLKWQSLSSPRISGCDLIRQSPPCEVFRETRWKKGKKRSTRQNSVQVLVNGRCTVHPSSSSPNLLIWQMILHNCRLLEQISSENTRRSDAEMSENFSPKTSMRDIYIPSDDGAWRKTHVLIRCIPYTDQF